MDTGMTPEEKRIWLQEQVSILYGELSERFRAEAQQQAQEQAFRDFHAQLIARRDELIDQMFEAAADGLWQQAHEEIGAALHPRPKLVVVPRERPWTRTDE